jgi:hypothetical protein
MGISCVRQTKPKATLTGLFFGLCPRHAERRWCLWTTLLHEQAKAGAVGES